MSTALAAPSARQLFPLVNLPKNFHELFFTRPSKNLFKSIQVNILDTCAKGTLGVIVAHLERQWLVMGDAASRPQPLPVLECLTSAGWAHWVALQKAPKRESFDLQLVP